MTARGGWMTRAGDQLLDRVLGEQDELRRRVAEAVRARTPQHSNADVVHRVRRQAIAEYVRDAGDRLGSTLDEVRATVGILLQACDTVSRTAPPAGDDRARAEFVRGVLWGTLDDRRLSSGAAVYGAELGRAYRAVRGRPYPGHGVEELAARLGVGRRGSGQGFGAVVDGDLVGFVAAPPRNVMCGLVGLGPARPPGLLYESFRMASRALHTADRRGMRGLCAFESLGLLPAVLSDEATGNALARRYFTPLGDSEFAAEIVETLEAYLRHGMHAPRSARELCVHPNTVRYRIGKFEELAGVSLRQDRTAAFEVLWALEHRRTRGGAPGAPVTTARLSVL